mmetsp:Transcript_12561/g.20296  ORF Transcript_12561/g.20296 Transcript_12561/m.20296 type:complete len:265 (-) Transcript_12561:575-1369(-)
MAPIGWTNWSTRIVIHQHGFLPIILLCRLICTHVAISRPRIPTNLNTTRAPISHRLLALGTSNISCRSPQSLRKVCIIRIRPCFLPFEPPSTNVLNRIELSPLPIAGILGEVLALFSSRLVNDTSGITSPKQIVCPIFGMSGQAQIVLERNICLAKLHMILLPPPIVRIEVLDLALTHLVVSSRISHDDIVRDALPIVKVRSVDHELIVHVDFISAFALLAAYAIAYAIGHCECVLAVWDTGCDHIRGERAVTFESLLSDDLVC